MYIVKCTIHTNYRKKLSLLCEFWYRFLGIDVNVSANRAVANKKPRHKMHVFFRLISEIFMFQKAKNAQRTKDLTKKCQNVKSRARIFKLLRGPGIDSKESISPIYVALADRYDN
jgi:hypothetical protein